MPGTISIFSNTQVAALLQVPTGRENPDAPLKKALPRYPQELALRIEAEKAAP